MSLILLRPGTVIDGAQAVGCAVGCALWFVGALGGGGAQEAGWFSGRDSFTMVRVVCCFRLATNRASLAK